MDNKQNNKNDNNNSNGFFDKNPIIVFVIFSVVTIMAFKSFFPSDDMSVNSGQPAYGQSVSKNVAYSDIKKLINNGEIEYVGIGDTNIKAISKPVGGTVTTYRARKVGNDVKGYRDFREVLQRPDIDIVHIATPPHWHGIMSVMAAEAGKDVWCEKPMTRTIGEGKRVVEAMKQHGRMFRLNTWFRFKDNFYGMGTPVKKLKKVVDCRRGGAREATA